MTGGGVGSKRASVPDCKQAANLDEGELKHVLAVLQYCGALLGSRLSLVLHLLADEVGQFPGLPLRLVLLLQRRGVAFECSIPHRVICPSICPV